MVGWVDGWIWMEGERERLGVGRACFYICKRFGHRRMGQICGIFGTSSLSYMLEAGLFFFCFFFCPRLIA